MPELPEVEVICRGVRPHLVGRAVTGVATSGKRLREDVPLALLVREMIGRRIISVTRRAKFLQIGLESGSMLVIHLGMTGNLGFFPCAIPPAKHDHVCWTLDDGRELRYNDSRRFGTVRILSAEEVPRVEETIFKTMGPEPFGEEFSAEYLFRLSRNREVTVKSFLMTSQVVVGVGNIYANESLFRAGIRPNRPVRSLDETAWRQLVAAIREVLTHAIACGGSTISDFVNAGREKGYFQVNFKVYDKEGTACTACGATILKKVIGGRASYWCPECQG